MKKIICYFLLSLIWPVTIAQSQQWKQYFDGEDTLFDQSGWNQSIKIEFDTSSTNIWQIGVPQKTMFNSAASLPNVLRTDTLNPYPPHNTSSFWFTIKPHSPGGILAIRWKQKLDMQFDFDGGKVEFSTNGGASWVNAIHNPYVYNFFGYDNFNVDTLSNGDFVFSGTDASWKDIWLCFGFSWINNFDSLMLKFTFMSDIPNTNSREGWMIDNMQAHKTFLHTINENKSDKYIHVFPNPAKDLLNIEVQKTNDYHIIETMQLINSLGQIIEEWSCIPTKFFIDTRKYVPGHYFLVIKTNLKTETTSVIIER